MPDDAETVRSLPAGGLAGSSERAGLDAVVTPASIRRARALLGWSTVTLARKSRADYSALVRAQMPTSADPLNPAVLACLQRTFEAAGLIFDRAVGVRLRRDGDPAAH